MRKVKLFIAVSLDGVIARPNGDVDWLFTDFTDEDYGYSDFFDSIDVVLMGRKTYEQILEFGEYPYKGKMALIFSRRGDIGGSEYIKVILEDIAEFV